MQSIAPSPHAGNATRSAIALLLLTSIHHVYGGYIYATPWRYHAVPVSVATLVAMLGALALWRRRPSVSAGRIARIVFLLTTLAIPVVGFGLFEGLYNHVVKNLLYFAGAPAAVLARLFPPPTYEMPNDVFFEITGILQVIPAALAAWFLYRILRPGRRSHSILLQRGAAVASRDGWRTSEFSSPLTRRPHSTHRSRPCPARSRQIASMLFRSPASHRR